MATTSAADAQVVYTDINPDLTLVDNSYLLDINNDGTNDFSVFQIHHSHVSTFTFSGYTSTFSTSSNKVTITPLNNNEVEAWYGGVWTFPSDYWANFNNLGAQIGWGASWAADVATLAYYYPNHPFGFWLGVEDKYLGLRIDIGGQWYYGWLRLDVGEIGEFVTVKDYAFEATPNVPISAGDMGISQTCDYPSNIQVVNVLPTKVKLSWDAVPNAHRYQIVYKEVGVPPPIHKKNSYDTTRIINGLQPGRTYRFKIRTKCQGIGWSDYSASSFFTTPPLRQSQEPANNEIAIYSFENRIFRN